MIPILHTALFKVNCRTCLKDFDLEIKPITPIDDIDIELAAHEALEDAGWADSQCPDCLERSLDEFNAENSVYEGFATTEQTRERLTESFTNHIKPL